MQQPAGKQVPAACIMGCLARRAQHGSAATCLPRSCDNATLTAFNKTLTWVENSLWDSEFGEVYWQVDVPSGKVRRAGAAKAVRMHG
jgi:hypothetical protein